MSANQVEAGFCCPITMTFAAVPALRAAAEIADEWVPRLAATGYDGALRPASDGRKPSRSASALARLIQRGSAAGSNIVVVMMQHCAFDHNHPEQALR